MKIPKNLTDANQLLRRQCEIELRLQEILAEQDKMILAARQAAKKTMDPLLREHATGDRALRSWFATWRKQNPGVKSLLMAFGSFLVRTAKSVHLLERCTEESVVATILGGAAYRALRENFIRTKHELNKSAIHDADERELALLAAVGITVESKESVTIDTNLEALQPSRDRQGAGVQR